MLEIEGIYKTFKMRGRSIYPLLGASLFVDDGVKVGILGKSGEGKSTFANIICGAVKPDSGNVYLDEYPLYDKKYVYDQKAGKKIQLIPQQPYTSFDPMQRVGSAVEEVVLVNGRDIGRAEAKAKTERLFERVMLDCALMDRLPSQLSGGQIQRVAIARAMAMNPDVIISDEATSMLDASSQAQIIRILNDLVINESISVIFISHDEKLTQSFADTVYKLEDGIFRKIEYKK